MFIKIKILSLLVILCSCFDDYRIDTLSSEYKEELQQLVKKIKTNTPLTKKDFNNIFLYTKEYNSFKEDPPIKPIQLGHAILYSKERNLIVSYLRMYLRHPQDPKVIKGLKEINSSKRELVASLISDFSQEDQSLIYKAL